MKHRLRADEGLKARCFRISLARAPARPLARDTLVIFIGVVYPRRGECTKTLFAHDYRENI